MSGPRLQFTLEDLEAYIAEERRGEEVMRRYFRVYGWRTLLNWPRDMRWYGVKEYLSMRFSVSDGESIALFRLEAVFIGTEGDARRREEMRLTRGNPFD